MTFEHAVLGHKVQPNDLYQIALWLGATVFVMTGLVMIAWNVDMASMFIVLCVPTAVINVFWLNLLKPVTGISFNKLELLILSIILFIGWAIASVLWLNAFEGVVIAILLLGLIVIICLLPKYAGTEISPEMDERIRKIVAFTGSDAFNISFVFTALMFLLSFFKVVTMNVAQGFFLIFLLMLFARTMAMAYYSNRGDVE